MASQLSATFNEGFIGVGSTVEMENEEVRDERQQNDDETVTGIAGSKEYFTSSAWPKKIEEKVKLYQALRSLTTLTSIKQRGNPPIKGLLLSNATLYPPFPIL